MEQYAGIDVSLESASVCVVDASGRILREAKVASEPEALITWFGKSGFKPRFPRWTAKTAGLTEGKASDPSPLQRDTVANDAKALSSAR
jgi:hypothetical protein